MSADGTHGAERKTIWSIFRPGYEGACDDPTTAPARHYGPDAAAPFTLRRRSQNKVWIYAFGLVFLLFAIAAIPRTTRRRPSWLWRILLVVLLAVGYLATAWIADCSLRTRWLYLGAYSGLLLAELPDLGLVAGRLRGLRGDHDGDACCRGGSPGSPSSCWVC